MFIPDLGGFVNRAPTYTLTRRPSKVREEAASATKKPEPAVSQEPLQPIQERPQPVRSMTTALGPDRFAVLPDGATLEGWTQGDIEELNDHVRHMLHSRRSKFKRAMKGFGQYIRRREHHPVLLFFFCRRTLIDKMKIALGFLVTLYATLITLFGLAWVLFLIGTCWIFCFLFFSFFFLGGPSETNIQVGLMSAENNYT